MLRAEFANPQHRLLPGGSVTIILRPRQSPESPMIPPPPSSRMRRAF
jgi:hypothetical protein